MCEKNHQSFSAFSHINNARSLARRRLMQGNLGQKNSYNFSICQAYVVEQLPPVSQVQASWREGFHETYPCTRALGSFVEFQWCARAL